jgi:hypothetical protein
MAVLVSVNAHCAVYIAHGFFQLKRSNANSIAPTSNWTA